MDARFEGSKEFYTGEISHINDDGTYIVEFDDDHYSFAFNLLKPHFNSATRAALKKQASSSR